MYAVLAAASAAALAKMAGGGLQVSAGAAVITSAWAAASIAAVLGLAMMRRWGRRLAVWLSMGLLLSMLAAAALAIAQSPPSAKGSLIAMGLAAVQMVVIRYLTRPRVKQWFEVSPGASSGR